MAAGSERGLRGLAAGRRPTPRDPDRGSFDRRSLAFPSIAHRSDERPHDVARTVALAGAVVLASLVLALAWWMAGSDAASLGEAPSSDFVLATAPATHPQPVDLNGPLARSPAPVSEPAIAEPLVAATREPVRPPLVDASSRAFGIDLHGSIHVLGGRRENLPQLTLKFSQGSLGHDALASQAEYLLPGIEPGRWKITAEVAGYKPLSMDVVVASEPREQEVNVFLERLPQLFVKMVTPEGEQLADAARKEKGALARMQVIAIATREPPPDRLPATLEDTYDSFGHATWTPISRVGAPVGATLRGVRGESPNGSSVVRYTYATDPHELAMLPHGSSASPQAVDVPAGYSGILDLARPLPAYVSACVADTVLRTQFVPFGAEEVVFVISADELRGKRGALRFRIVDDETGRPLTDGRVGLHANGQFGMGNPIIDPNGWVEFEDEPPGPRHLSVVVRGFEWIVEQVWIEPGRVTDLGTYRLRRPIAIQGEVYDEGGVAVRAWVSVWPLERYASTQRILDKFCWRADPEGHFTVRPVGPQKYVLRANDEEWAGEPVVVDASAGPVGNVRLRVARGTSVTVSYDADTPRGARLAVFDANDMPVAERAVDASRTSSLRVAPGRYRLEVLLGDESISRRAIEVGRYPLDVSMAR